MTIDSLTQSLASGSVILYPTEAVWGLGCDPFSEQAVAQLLQLKGRSPDKGLILLVSHWDQVHSLVASNAAIDWERIRSSWPGPQTWVFPASDRVPLSCCAAQGGIALRMPSFPLLQSLLRHWGGALVSTSANLSGQPAQSNQAAVQAVFPGLPCLEGECEGLNSVSSVRDAITGQRYR